MPLFSSAARLTAAQQIDGSPSGDTVEERLACPTPNARKAPLGNTEKRILDDVLRKGRVPGDRPGDTVEALRLRPDQDLPRVAVAGSDRGQSGGQIFVHGQPLYDEGRALFSPEGISGLLLEGLASVLSRGSVLSRRRATTVGNAVGGSLSGRNSEKHAELVLYLDREKALESQKRRSLPPDSHLRPETI